MEWRSVTFDWNRARAFLVTAEEGSLSAAARALGMAQPTLGRQVAALEVELGVALFERAGRGLVLTPSGLELVEHVRAMGEAATRVSLTASGKAQSIDGVVRITATEGHAAYALPPIVEQIRAAAPDLTIEIVASNALSDLRRREADIALRSGQPADPELIACKLRDEAAYLYATPAYLESIGRPMEPAQFAEAQFIGFEENKTYLDALTTRGFPLGERNFRIRSASHFVHWEMTKQGLGIGVMVDVAGESEPLVERALPTMQAFSFPLWLAAHRELRTSRRIRLVFDIMTKALQRSSL